MEIQNTKTAPSTTNQPRNVNTVRWESGNIASQPGEIDEKKCEVTAFVVNAGMNVIGNNFHLNQGEKFLYLKYLFCLRYIRNMFLKFRVINIEYIVKISRGIVKRVFKVIPF